MKQRIRRLATVIAVVLGCYVVPTGLADASMQSRFGLRSVHLLTKTTGVGIHPQLRWKPVPGAARYRVGLLDARRHAYWSWDGTTSHVTVSATGERVRGSSPSGPRIGKHYRWSVAAFNAAGKPIALSALRSISP